MVARDVLAASILALWTQAPYAASVPSSCSSDVCPDKPNQRLSRESVLLQLQHQSGHAGLDVERRSARQTDNINVCYFTNWARYRSGLINTGKDVFEMDFPGELCTHFMYGFATVTPDFKIQSNDPNADHPSGSEAQSQLCDDRCSDPSFKPDWSDPNGLRCDWPCNPSRVLRGYEAATVGMKKKNPNIKSLISVGGWNFNDCTASEAATFGQGAATCEIFSELASSETTIRTFAKNVIDFCRKWGFDGFDLDWEYPVVPGHNSNNRIGKAWQETPQDYKNYITMLRIMKEEFQKENPNNPLLLTAAVGVGKSTAETAYDIPEMNKHLDLINLMTYDLHGAWEPHTACNANLFATKEDTELAEYPLSVDWAVSYWLAKGASADKLTMGIGTYGRGWKLQDPSNTAYGAPTMGASTAGLSTKEAGYMGYYEVLDLIASGAATRHYDSERECPYIITTSGEWIGYDDEQSLRAKVAVVKERGLRGTMVWTIDLDDMTGQYSSGKRYPLTTLLKDLVLSGGEGSVTPALTPVLTPAPTPVPTPAPTPLPTPLPTVATTQSSTTAAPSTTPPVTVPASSTTGTTTTTAVPTTTASTTTTTSTAVPTTASTTTTEQVTVPPASTTVAPPVTTASTTSANPTTAAPSTTAKPTTATTTTTAAPTTTAVTTTAESTTAAPASTTGSAPVASDGCGGCESCEAVPGNAQSATDGQCTHCAMGGQSWWPCNVKGLCRCAAGSDPAAPTETPAAPTETPSGPKDCKTCGTCKATPGNSQGASDGHCQPCAMGSQTWWPCNVDGLCECAE
eukprot:TRINITY_DN18238_c0_g1_i1.p1 TRINITY_DN18238_c0_g1~~TRINITY_DN18238_c0_g1_i1.p1  ORF type:complete len:799 (+),score=136.39 TRINITY_DN18238_c0_g1_i1:173-2569(+)